MPLQALWLMVALWPKLPTEVRTGLAMAPDSQPADLAKAFFTPQQLQKALPALLATSVVLPHLHGVWGAIIRLAGTGSKSGRRLAALWEQVRRQGPGNRAFACVLCCLAGVEHDPSPSAATLQSGGSNVLSVHPSSE